MDLPTDEDNSGSGVGEINIRGFDLYLFADIEEVLPTLKACVNNSIPFLAVFQLREFDGL
jgi:hypothetical protein